MPHYFGSSPACEMVPLERIHCSALLQVVQDLQTGGGQQAGRQRGRGYKGLCGCYVMSHSRGFVEAHRSSAVLQAVTVAAGPPA